MTKLKRFETGFPDCTFYLTDPGGYVEIKASDNGADISADIRGLFFEPYFTTKKPGEKPAWVLPWLQ